MKYSLMFFFPVKQAGLRSADKGRQRNTILHLHIPVLIQIVDAGNAAPISVWIIHVTHVFRAVARVTSHHSLRRKAERSFWVTVAE